MRKTLGGVTEPCEPTTPLFHPSPLYRFPGSTVHYEDVAGKAACLTWLRKMSAYSAGHKYMLCSPKHRGSTCHSIASRKTEVFLASAMYSQCTIRAGATHRRVARIVARVAVEIATRITPHRTADQTSTTYSPSHMFLPDVPVQQMCIHVCIQMRELQYVTHVLRLRISWHFCL